MINQIANYSFSLISEKKKKIYWCSPIQGTFWKAAIIYSCGIIKKVFSFCLVGSTSYKYCVIIIFLFFCPPLRYMHMHCIWFMSTHPREKKQRIIPFYVCEQTHKKIKFLFTRLCSLSFHSALGTTLKCVYAPTRLFNVLPLVSLKLRPHPGVWTIEFELFVF